MELTKLEWMQLRTMAWNLLQNVSSTGEGYYTVSDTLIEEEVELLKKIANGNVSDKKS